MAGGLMTLVSRGTENVILNGNPKKTFFKAIFTMMSTMRLYFSYLLAVFFR